MIHCQDVVEIIEVVAVNAARALGRQIIAALSRCFDHAAIRQVAIMIPAGASTIDHPGETSLLRLVPQHCFGDGGSANIAQTDTENTHTDY